MSEQEMIKRGELLASVLMLKKDKLSSDRYLTQWGTKTALGLFLTVSRILERGE